MDCIINVFEYRNPCDRKPGHCPWVLAQAAQCDSRLPSREGTDEDTRLSLQLLLLSFTNGPSTLLPQLHSSYSSFLNNREIDQVPPPATKIVFFMWTRHICSCTIAIKVHACPKLNFGHAPPEQGRLAPRMFCH